MKSAPAPTSWWCREATTACSMRHATLRVATCRSWVAIWAHSLSDRPVRDSPGTVIELSLEGSIDAGLQFDGQLQCALQEGDRVLIRRAEHTVKFVPPPGYSYFAMWRQKLHCGEVF